MSSTSKQPDKVVKSNERERSESSESCETRSRSSSVSSDTSVEIIPNPKIRKFKGNDLPSTSNRPVPKSRSSDRPVRQVAKRARSASSTPSNTSRSNSQSRGRPRTREKKKKATKAAVRSPSDGSPVPASYSPDCHASSSAKERKVVQISRSSSSDSSDTEVVPPKSKKSKKSKTSKEKEPKNSKSNDSKKKSKTEEMTKKSKNGKHVSSNKKSPKKNNNKNPIETESDDSRSSNGDSESSDNELERDETEEDTDETDYVILSSDAEQNDSDGSNYRPSDSKGLRPGTGPSLRSNNPFVPRRSKRTCGNYPLYVDLSSDSDEQSDSTVRNDETNVESVPGSSSKKAKTRKQKTVQMEVEEPGEQASQASESNNAEEKKKRGRPRKIKVEVMNTEENEKEVPLGIQMAVVEADPEKLISKTSETPGIKTRSSYKKAASSAAVAENITARGQGKNNSLSGRGSASLVPAADIDTESSEEEPSSSEPKPIKQRETKNSIAASLNICRSSVGPNMFIKNELVEPAPEQELVANQGNPGMEPSSPSQAQDNSLDLNSNLHPIPSLLVGNEEQDSNRLIVDDNTVLPQAPAQNQQGTSSSVQLMPLNHGALLSMLPKASIKVEVMEQEEEEESLLTSTPLEVAAPKRTRGSRKRYSPTPERESTSSSVDKSTKQKHIKNNDHPGLHHQDLSVSVGFSGSLHSSSNTSPNSSVATSALSSPQVLGTMQVATKTIKMEVPDHSNPKQPENEYCPHITNILESLFELHPNYIDHQTKIWSDWRINTSLSPYRINKWLDDRRQQDGLPRLTTQRSSNVHPRSLTRTEPLPLETGSVNDILEALFAAYPNYKEGESQKSRLKQVIHWSKYKINKWFDNKRNQLRALEQDSQQQQNTNEQPHQTTDNIATDQLPIDEAPQSEEIVNESPQEAISIQSPFAPLNIEYLDAPSNALIPVQNGFNCKMEMSTADQNQTFWGYEWEVPASEQNGSDYHTGTPMPDQPKYSFNSIVEAPPSVPHGFGYNTGMQMPNRQATYDTYSWQTQVPMDNGFGGRMGMISNQQNFCKLGRETPAPAVSDKHVIAILEKHFAEHPEYTDTEWGGNLLRKKTGWSSMQINLWFKTKRNQKLILDRIAAQMKLVVEFPQENDSPSLEDQQATLLLEGVYQSDPEYVEFGYTKLEDDTKWSQEQINDWFYARRNQDQMLNDIFFHQYQFVSKQRAEELSQSVGLSALKIYMWFFETRVKIFRDHQQKILKELPLQMKILEEAYISCHDYEQHDIQNLKKLSGTTYFQAAGYFKSRRQIDVMRDSTRCMTSEDPKREGFDFMYPHVHKEYSVFDLHEYHFPKNLYSGQTDNEKVRKCRKRARGHLFEKIPLPFNHSIYYEKYTPSEAFEFFDQFLSPNALNTLRGRGIYTDDLKRFLAQDESLFNELNAETRIYCLKYDAFSKLDFLKVGDILHQIHSAALQWVDNFHAPNQ